MTVAVAAWLWPDDGSVQLSELLSSTTYWLPAWPIYLSLCVCLWECVKRRDRARESRSLGFRTLLLSLGTIWAGAGLDRAGQRVINVHQWPMWHCQEMSLHHSLITTRIQGYWDNKAASKTQ
ncbi:hypothetical protein QQF64_029197 [Cirrhinus molitorella]|uniref:Uncharacterized protein n=1 Tax=Cirrhinus molitorella TaxID=172907 RepID=A0ABR3N8S3_9TELE